MTDEDTGNLDERVDRLEAGQDTLSQKLDQILGIVTSKPAAPEGTGTSPGGRPPDVESMVRAELARAEHERKAAADAEAEKSDRETIKEQLAKLREAAPVPPQPRAQRVIWGSNR